MSDFFFQQFASRDQSGYRWLENFHFVPHEWLANFEEALKISNLVPSDGSKLGNELQGGVYCPASGDFAVVFAFRPAPSDFKGRSGGLIINALFCKGHPFPQASLKKVWEHNYLCKGIETSALTPILIPLDLDYGNTKEEQRFFGVLKNYRQGEKCFESFTSTMGTRSPVSDPTPPQPEPRVNKPPVIQPPVSDPTPSQSEPRINKPSVTQQPSPSPRIETQQPRGKNTRGNRMKYVVCVMIGIIIGVVAVIIVGHYVSPKSPAEPDAKALIEISLEFNDGQPAEFVLELKCLVKKDAQDKLTFTVVSLEKQEAKEPVEHPAGHTKDSSTPAPTGFLNGPQNGKENW